MERGTHDELLKLDGHNAQLHQMQYKKVIQRNNDSHHSTVLIN